VGSWSISGPEAARLGGGDVCLLMCGDAVARLADALGMSPGDLTFALGVPDGVPVLFYAYRAPGAAAEDLLDAVQQSGGIYMNHYMAMVSPTVLRVGSRDVLYIPSIGIDPGDSSTGEYDVAYDGVLIEVVGEAPGADGTVPEAVDAAVRALR
jgi:hypothetical protein